MFNVHLTLVSEYPLDTLEVLPSSMSTQHQNIRAVKCATDAGLAGSGVDLNHILY
jgi:hypothetical protein